MAERLLIFTLTALVVVLLIFLAIAVYLAVKLIKTGKIIKHENMPHQGKIAFWSALIYAISPIDLLPDPIYLDDIGVLAIALWFIHHLARQNGITFDKPVDKDFGVPADKSSSGTVIDAESVSRSTEPISQ